METVRTMNGTEMDKCLNDYLSVSGDGFTVFHGSNLDVLPLMADNSVDSIVTDPPYELGFMGKSWDSSGIAYSVELWRECLRVLKPGGHLLAFSGSRTYHRMVVAIEDSGFEIRDMVSWISNKTFPKSHNIGKATGLDEWAGWGTALKPSVEPIVMARKPLIGTVAENVLTWGVGGLNIDGSRIAWASEQDRLSNVNAGGFTKAGYVQERNIMDRQDGGIYDAGRVTNPNPVSDKGRWPANIILDEYTAELLDEQSGHSKSVRSNRGEMTSSGSNEGWVRDSHKGFSSERGFEDSGGASRFFYVARASKRDRNEGLDELPKIQKSVGQETFATICPKHKTQKELCGCPAWKPVANIHPTVKPTNLMRYLIKLVTPAGGLVLDPFTGSGSTGKAALLDGYKFTGIELTADYLPIIEGRLKWASEQATKQQELEEEKLF